MYALVANAKLRWTATLIGVLIWFSAEPSVTDHHIVSPTCPMCWPLLGVGLMWACWLFCKPRPEVELDRDAPACERPPRRRPAPPLTVRAVPQDRYLFIATNDPEVDLPQPKLKG